MLSFRRRRTSNGFTFLEIMFVVVIIGILLALVGPKLLGRTEHARIVATKAQLQTLATGIKAYEMEMGGVPKKLDQLVQEDTTNHNWNGPYLDADVVPMDAWSQEFNYKAAGEHNKRTFDLWSNGPDKQEGTADDIGNWTVSAN